MLKKLKNPKNKLDKIGYVTVLLNHLTRLTDRTFARE